MSEQSKRLGEPDLRELGKAAAELVHDLRNLLVGVVAQADLLAEGRAEDPARTAALLRGSAISCKSLVDDVPRPGAAHAATGRPGRTLGPRP